MLCVYNHVCMYAGAWRSFPNQSMLSQKLFNIYFKIAHHLYASSMCTQTCTRKKKVRAPRQIVVRKRVTANLRTTILDFRGFDSSRILSSRAGILMPIGHFLEIMSQAWKSFPNQNKLSRSALRTHNILL